MDGIRHAIFRIVTAGTGMTVRHLFYRLVAAGVVEKTEAEYDGTVARLTVELRRTGDIPYGKIIDGSRLYSMPRIYDGIEHALNDIASTYRRSYWREAPIDLEVWCEKDAIRGLIEDVTWELAAPLMVTRGFSSESVIRSLAVSTKVSRKPRVILSLRDFDPSGSLMLADIIRRASHYAPGCRFISEQIALTREQVTEYRLPTRPTKISGNPHAARFTDPESVELDAMEADDLRTLLRTAIESYMEPRALLVIQAAEESEREGLRQLVAGLAA